MDMLKGTECSYCLDDKHKVRQLSVAELADIFKEEESLFFAIRLLTMPFQSLIKTTKTMEVSEFTGFLQLLIIDSDAAGFSLEEKQKVLNFIQASIEGCQELTLSPTALILKFKEKDFLLINDDNFQTLKDIYKDMFNIAAIFGTSEQQYKPKNARAAAIAAALEEGRKQVNKINETKHDKGIIENYLSILSISLHTTPKLLSQNITLYNLFALQDRFTMKQNWDLDIQCRIAGGSPEKQPKHWMSLI